MPSIYQFHFLSQDERAVKIRLNSSYNKEDFKRIVRVEYKSNKGIAFTYKSTKKQQAEV